MHEYIRKIEEKGELPIESSKILTVEEKKEEYIMLSLRTSDGIDLDEYKDEFGESFLAKRKETVASLIKQELLILTKDNRLVCTTDGFLVLNKIVLELVTSAK